MLSAVKQQYGVEACVQITCRVLITFDYLIFRMNDLLSKPVLIYLQHKSRASQLRERYRKER